MKISSKFLSFEQISSVRGALKSSGPAPLLRHWIVAWWRAFKDVVMFLKE
ncbi:MULTISPECIES: hypothetical protein [Bartonella]|nr:MULTISPECIES: hypothetical protein [Bartonella]